MKKIWFLPMLASSTMLTGCASLLQDSATYDPEVSRAGNIGKIFEIEIDDQEVAQGIEPVSYTHLDVYKRQMYLTPVFLFVTATRRTLTGNSFRAAMISFYGWI